jgi:hypothetical protein
VVSAELYSLVCQGKVSIEDIASVFAVGKSPEILVKNYAAVKASAVAKAPANTATLEPEATTEGDLPPGSDEPPVSVDGAFDGRELTTKKLDELLVIAGTVGVDTAAEGFVVTRGSLIKAIMARAAKATEAKVPAVPPAE